MEEQTVKCDFGATLGTEIKQEIILVTSNNKLQSHCFLNQDVTLQQLLLHIKSLKDVANQTRAITKMTENVAAVNLTRQQQPSKLTRLGKNICFQCEGNYQHSKGKK